MVTLEQAIEQLHAEIEDFKKFWLEQQKKEPEHFTVELESIAEWEEQLLAFMNAKSWG